MISQLLDRAAERAAETAVVDAVGAHSYGDLLARSATVAARLLARGGDLTEARVAFLVPPGFEHVAVQWGIWRAGGIAVPLCLSHPKPELDYVLEDSDASVLIFERRYGETAATLEGSPRLRRLPLEEIVGARGFEPPSPPSPERRCMLVYTSGTTGRPKGVVFTHDMLRAQVEALLQAWAWSSEDRILNVLPLHHVHGIVNVLTCALAAGATWETHETFTAEAIWDRFAISTASKVDRLTLFMAVPTIYVRLIRAFEQAPPDRQEAFADAARSLRLMVSGSAALPVDVLERWREITGHVLLERYGMTEIGMALSNPLEGERRPGRVGHPLPGVEARVVGEGDRPVALGEAGQLQVRGENVFREYWHRPEATAESFRDGWFLTGDEAEQDPEDGSYRLLGRRSVDILKTGGYKVSALEIEAELRRHPKIRDCAVVGLEHPEWGQEVAAAVIPENPSSEPTLEELRAWGRERLAPYKLPRRLLLVEDLPRNALGKVLKPAVAALF